VVNIEVKKTGAEMHSEFLSSIQKIKRINIQAINVSAHLCWCFETSAYFSDSIQRIPDSFALHCWPSGVR